MLRGLDRRNGQGAQLPGVSNADQPIKARIDMLLMDSRTPSA